MFCLFILSCRKYEHKRQRQRATWLKAPPVPLWFHVQGDESLTEEWQFDMSENLLTVRCPDDYMSLCKKTWTAIKAIRTQYPAVTHILKTDDDMDCNLEAIRKLSGAFAAYDYGGNFTVIPTDRLSTYHYHSAVGAERKPAIVSACTYGMGRFYFLSSWAADIILSKQELFWSRVFEDNTVGFALSAASELKRLPVPDKLCFKEWSDETVVRHFMQTAVDSSRFLDFIERVVYINLAHRTDRRTEIEAELACFGTDRVERFDAICHAHGGLGCSKSHLAVLERAKVNGWRNVLIVEDDFVWHAREAGIPRLNALAAAPYDVILLAAGHSKYDPTTLRVESAQTTTCYLVAAHYYDTLIANYKEGIAEFESTMKYEKYALDQWWKQLQPRDRWYIMRPTLGYQRPSYSDIERKVVDYRRGFLAN